MARVKRGVIARARHKKILKQAKGYYGARSVSYTHLDVYKRQSLHPVVMHGLSSIDHPAYIVIPLRRRGGGREDQRPQR